ncbi:hypothetical protein GQ44DRAFT_751899 [Phaeosphaeriaceae sp. PMI808]|nr:hypothetical protein GQ44DRAFT_751899 [Phaeosphaeriaceae sp. PMI808]
MERRISLQELIRKAGPCLPAPTEPAITASEEDHVQARALLLNGRARNPEHKDVLRRIFRSSKDKKESQDGVQFSQEELDLALSAVLRGPTTSPGLTQAFLDLGAKVNFIETPEKKRRQSNQTNNGLRRRSTVLQQAATLRRPACVSLLANSGADQTTLNEGLKAALASNDQECIQELLRHGADPNQLPNALANAVRTNDQNFVRTLLRAPKPIQTKIISSCLPAAVQQGSNATISLLIAYNADPNFDSASALNMAIGKQDYTSAVALVAGPIPLSQGTLQRLLDTTMRLPTVEAQLRYLQLLFCCGLPPDSIGLSDLLVCRAKKGDTAGVLMMLSYGVSTATNEVESLRVVISQSNWRLADAILQTPISPQQASVALAVLPANAPQPQRLHVVQSLVQKGANGPPLEYWLTRAVEEGDTALMDLLLSAGAPVASSNRSPILAKAFPLLRSGFSTAERLNCSRLLLQYGAHGSEVDQALIDAVADTSPTRDPALITELVRRGASANYDNGKVLQLAVSQVDLSLLRLLCSSKPASSATSAALALAFDSHGNRHSRTVDIINLLLAHGLDEKPAGGPENIDIIKQLITANIRLLSPAFEYAVAIEDPKQKALILDVLLKMGVGQEALDKALAAESRNAISNKDITSVEMLVEKGASVAIDSALRAAIAGPYDSRHSEALVGLLLQHNANVNMGNGICFVLAAQIHSTTILEALMLHSPDFGVIVTKLISSNLEEDIVVRSIKLCCAQPGCSPDELERHSYSMPNLVLAMQEYPRCETLVTTLLLQGCDPNISVRDVIDSSTQEEDVSPLLWALNQTQKRISDSVIMALLNAGARNDIVRALLERGADASARDKSNRSALFYASSALNPSSIVQILAPHALKNDGSLHEAARCLQVEAVATLISHGHNAKFRARNEMSPILLALENAYSALDISEALLETEVWEDLNDDKNMYRDSSGLWYSPLKYIELIPSPSRVANKQDLLDLVRDKGCEPRFYSESAIQPPGAIGIPKPVARLVDRQKEHELSIKHDSERHEHTRSLEETSHRDTMRRKREQQESDALAQTHAHNHNQALEQQTHDATIRRVREAERMKRSEKVAWHTLQLEQEHEASARRASLKERETAATVSAESRLIEQRKSELEHRAGVERRMLKDKEDVYERNVKRQTEVMKRADESAQLHARLRQERPAIEGAPQWGSVD